MTGCGLIIGLLAGALLLIPGLCVMIQSGGSWRVVAIGVGVAGIAVVIWAVTRRPRE